MSVIIPLRDIEQPLTTGTPLRCSAVRDLEMAPKTRFLAEKNKTWNRARALEIALGSFATLAATKRHQLEVNVAYWPKADILIA
jgi:hypothetical protein